MLCSMEIACTPPSPAIHLLPRERARAPANSHGHVPLRSCVPFYSLRAIALQSCEGTANRVTPTWRPVNRRQHGGRSWWHLRSSSRRHYWATRRETRKHMGGFLERYPVVHGPHMDAGPESDDLGQRNSVVLHVSAALCEWASTSSVRGVRVSAWHSTGAQRPCAIRRPDPVFGDPVQAAAGLAD